MTPVGGVDEQVLYMCNRVDVVVGHAHCKVEALGAVLHLAHHLATDGGIDKLGKLRQGDAVACKQCAAWTNVELRTLHLLLHVEVCHPVNALGGLPNLRADGMQLCEVGAKHLDGNAGLCARQHGIDAV